MKSVLITGASRGIGWAAAERFQRAGYELYLVCHRDINDLACFPGHHYAGDAGDFSFVESVFQDIDRLEVLVNNAGMAYYGLLQDMEASDWDEVIRTNLTSMFNTCKLAIPKMLERKAGKIINISSVWGAKGAAFEAAYSASKGGVDAFTRALARELAPSNIQVNAVAPGVIDTSMNNHLSPEERRDLIREIPADRMGTPEEAAELIFLLAEGNEYLTGQIIGLDGGWN
ncbi:MAG: SDR family oxidoreductase [Lachnospiraceae bacterium]|nr:SDR family oxidoreductase [Lachnospiraceae bacterium]